METQRSLSYGREKGTAAEKQNKDERKQQLLGILTEDLFNIGEHRTVKEYADELGISEKTVKRYVMEDGRYSILYGGKIVEK